MKKKIYLDYNASTPLHPEVKTKISSLLTDHYGNPSSSHWAGALTKKVVEDARKQVASLINCSQQEILFTSGGSEANNHVLKGTFYSLKDKGNHIITSKIEHPSIINPCKFLEKLGAKITYVGVNNTGEVKLEEIEKAITPKTILISIMHANNEVGTIQPIKAISGIAKKHDILLHTDAAQTIGKIPVDVRSLGVDFLTITGHKFYAPKGVGALYIRKGVTIEPLIHGASHEDGRRAGTENVLLTAALGKTCFIAGSSKTIKRNKEILSLKKYLWANLKELFKNKISINGDLNNSLPNTLNISIKGFLGGDILKHMPEVAASTGSACHSGNIKPSAVLLAMGMPEKRCLGAIRFSLGWHTTKKEIDYLVEKLRSI